MQAVRCSKEGRTTDVLGRPFGPGPVLSVSGSLRALLEDEEKTYRA
ncbi:MAG: hypothetical protein AVDCRST_MAG78-2373 [uncultured Rubrobacteraceae bacterium]|uniref:Uncharacterized protein n=1 Tax=uncultured Rubrobacteraceae bacterium TaxID=349277 RepID=A0A6J4QBQ5_9ACTN|nr:MAG: hypothetical protein AVDCRST_MAG78-2373 [uncultured Rubrobacteraceae bacterium]